MPTPVKSDPSAGRFSLGPGHLVFAAVFALRCWVLLRLTRSPLLLPSRGDMHFYNDWAREILSGHFTQPLAFYGLPGYAYLLAFLYRLFGENPFVPGLLQAALDAGTALLIYEISRHVFTSAKPATIPNSRAIGVIGAFGWAFFIPAQAYSAVLMPTAWFVFVFWLVVWRVVRSEAAPGGLECFVLALLIGLMATAVATILAVVPLLFAALLIRPANGTRRWPSFVRRVGTLILGLAIGT